MTSVRFRLHPDLRCGEREARPRREGEEGIRDGRQDLQGSSRRRQSDAGTEDKPPREGFIYWSNDGDCMAMRIRRFKSLPSDPRCLPFARDPEGRKTLSSRRSRAY